MKKLKMCDVISKEGYAALTAAERRMMLKVEQAKEYSGWRQCPATCAALVDQIPADWWDKYSAAHIGAVMAMIKVAYDSGLDNGRHDG